MRVRWFVCRVAACPQRICAERRAQLVGHYARPTPWLCDALQQIGLALVGAAGARLATVPGLQAGQTTLLGLIRRMFPQDHAVIACLAGRQEQGSQNSELCFRQASASSEASRPGKTAFPCP